MGLREVEEKTITMSFRMSDMQKKLVRFEDIASSVEDSLKQIQTEMYKASQESLKAMTHEVNDYDEFKQTMKTTRGFIKAFWCEDKECEAKIKEETKASTRCRPLDSVTEEGQCVYCKKDAKYKWYFAQAY